MLGSAANTGGVRGVVTLLGGFRDVARFSFLGLRWFSCNLF